MITKISRIDNSLPLPEYKTSGAAAFDLYSRIDMIIEPHEIALVPTNLIIETPEDHMLVVVPRSSTPKKKGLSIPHGIGIVDQDYCWSEDEIKIQFYNFTELPVTIERGERIGQATFVKISKTEWLETDDFLKQSRGGFGSTG